MSISVPRHLNKRPLIAGLEPIELLAVATLLISSNILAKFFSMSGLMPAIIAGISFGAMKLLKRGKARGHFIFVLRQQLKPQIKCGYIREG
ncbi:MAG: hypothetical protein SGI74_02250 [Oligoflexia bacterium]|nr:hypothetical protein [Oligoflexia bacterium]